MGRILKREFEMKKVLEGGNNMRESTFWSPVGQVKMVLKLLKGI